MQNFIRVLAIMAASLAPTTQTLSTFTPLDSAGPAFKVGIPSSSTISSSSTGGIYMQIRAPNTYRYVALGIGERMAGATIFVMYADGNGNVTVSARDGGQGHVMPVLDENVQQGVTLLEGSGVVDGEMVGNFVCTTCQLTTDKSSTDSPFISAWQDGSALDTTDLSATIRQHSGNAYAQFTFDLSQASIDQDSNPFISSSDSSSSTSANPTASGAAPTNSAETGDDNGTDDNGSGNGSSGTASGSGSAVVGGGQSDITTYQKAHGIIMAVVVVILLPLGAIIMRAGGSAMLHGAVQLFSLCALIAGFGLGVELGKLTDLLYNTTHTIFGTVIFALLLIQPLGGILHHIQYRKSGTRNPISHGHIWFGRILLILGIINGGLGLKLAANSKSGEIAYGVVAGVVGLAYVVLVVLRRKGGRGGARVDGVGKRDKEAVRDASS